MSRTCMQSRTNHLTIPYFAVRCLNNNNNKKDRITIYSDLSECQRLVQWVAEQRLKYSLYLFKHRLVYSTKLCRLYNIANGK